MQDENELIEGIAADFAMSVNAFRRELINVVVDDKIARLHQERPELSEIERVRLAGDFAERVLRRVNEIQALGRMTPAGKA